MLELQFFTVHLAYIKIKQHFFFLQNIGYYDRSGIFIYLAYAYL